MTRDTYIAIMVAAAKGKGLRLTADECYGLSFDDAIATRAHNGLDAEDWPSFSDPQGAPVQWNKIDPNKSRAGENMACRSPEDAATRS